MNGCGLLPDGTIQSEDEERLIANLAWRALSTRGNAGLTTLHPHLKLLPIDKHLAANPWPRICCPRKAKAAAGMPSGGHLLLFPAAGRMSAREPQLNQKMQAKLHLATLATATPTKNVTTLPLAKSSQHSRNFHAVLAASKPQKAPCEPQPHKPRFPFCLGLSLSCLNLRKAALRRSSKDEEKWAARGPL